MIDVNCLRVAYIQQEITKMSKQKIWVDDVRPSPYPSEESFWCRSVNSAKDLIIALEAGGVKIELIDIDHDAGDYAGFGGDYIKLLEWFEETGRNYPIHIHSMNPVGVENMRRIIDRNGWREVL